MQLIYPHSNLNVLNTLHSAITESLSMSWIVCVVQLLCSGRGVRTQEEGHTALAMKRERRKQRQCGKWYDDKGREHGLREKKCRLDVCSFSKDCKNRNPQHIAGGTVSVPLDFAVGVFHRRLTPVVFCELLPPRGRCICFIRQGRSTWGQIREKLPFPLDANSRKNSNLTFVTCGLSSDRKQSKTSSFNI